MYHIDFSQPFADEVQGSRAEVVIGNGIKHLGLNGTENGDRAKDSFRNSTESKSVNSIRRQGKSLVVVNMKNPVPFLGHTGPESVLIAEKPWLEVLRQFPAPVLRHDYGS